MSANPQKKNLVFAENFLVYEKTSKRKASIAYNFCPKLTFLVASTTKLTNKLQITCLVYAHRIKVSINYEPELWVCFPLPWRVSNSQDGEACVGEFALCIIFFLEIVGGKNCDRLTA